MSHSVPVDGNFPQDAALKGERSCCECDPVKEISIRPGANCTTWLTSLHHSLASTSRCPRALQRPRDQQAPHGGRHSEH
eukprot:446229-Hanusia_phi.AAC.2